MRIYIVTGDKDQGKTTFLKNFYEAVSNNSCLQIDGFITVKIFNKKFEGYNLLHLEGKRETKFIRISADKKFKENEILNYGPFSFYKDGIEKAELIVDNASKNGKEILIIDEIGKLDLSGNIFFNILKVVLSEKRFEALFLGVRNEFIPPVKREFGIEDKDLRVIDCMSDPLLLLDELTRSV